MNYYGMNNAANPAYGAAAALTYWVFRCRKNTSPAMGTKTWTFLESAIRNSAEISVTLEDYLQRLSNALHSELKPAKLVSIIRPKMRVLRVLSDLSEMQEFNDDQQNLQFMGWLDLLEDLEPHGYSEWDVLDLCRTRASIIQVICRLRFEEDRVLKQPDEDEEFIEVESHD